MRSVLAADLFCGAGGASVGLRRACSSLGLKADLLAVNHWPVAVETHTLNHPDVRHLCESIDRVDPRDAVPGGRLQLLIAAPECTFFSTARGGRPVNDQQRTQPWVILKWLQELYVENLLIENVPEFVQWGPVGANGKPLKSKKGQTFRAFLDQIRSLDYTVEYRILNAADYGDPTTRRRLFIIARRGRRSIAWPTPTHSRTGGRDLFAKMQKWRAAREVIDWSIQGRSIFGRKKPLSPKTLARIMAGLERFGGEELKPFLLVMRNHADGRSLDRPVPTIAAQGQHLGLVEPFLMPVTHGSDTSQRSLHDPLPTVTGAHRGELALCEPILVPNNHNNRAKTLDEPVPTVTGGGRHMLVEPFVLQQQSGGVPRSTTDPLPTISTDGAQMLIEPFIVPPRGFSAGPKVDSVDVPLRTIVAASGHNFAVVEPFIVQPTHGGGPECRVKSMDEPLGTIPCSNRFAVVEPSFLASYYGTQNISPVSDPIPTVTTKDRFALVMPVVNGRALDIRLRMLKPHELARAMSFDDDYQFAGNQGDQVKQIGNAWPCRLGQALIQVLIQDYAAKRVRPRRQLEAIA